MASIAVRMVRLACLYCAAQRIAPDLYPAACQVCGCTGYELIEDETTVWLRAS